MGKKFGVNIGTVEEFELQGKVILVKK